MQDSESQITEGGYTRKRIPESSWPEHLRDQRIASLEAEVEQLRAYSEVAADQLRRQNRMASELRAEADRYREALVDIRDNAGTLHDACAVAREALNGGTE